MFKFLYVTKCVIVLQKNDAGLLLFDLACEHLKIVEKQYFSLQISEDTSSSPVIERLFIRERADVYSCKSGIEKNKR